eukprot:Hpha_TRINITY_DN27254_c0_g1::TRINITY_DN27254_c0_g1_i1::g.140778::m.140778/K11864/BRCC3, BRCC36; BRCA1/BRCA2-containing complex subunit 3
MAGSGSLSGVVVADSVAWYCTTHALTTDKEEVMGLCLGDVIEVDGRRIGVVWEVVQVPRIDKRSDRVEISPVDMLEASTTAENIGRELGRSTRVVGWYHSHPNITCLPSHVDLATQRDYQMLDTGWVGLIFAVHANTTHKVGRMQVHCFQTGVAGAPNPPDTFSPEDSFGLEGDDWGGLEEADLRAAGVNTSELRHLQVPVAVENWAQVMKRIGAQHPGYLPPTLFKMRGMLDVFLQEEGQALNKEMDQDKGRGALCELHHSGVYQKAVCKVLNAVVAPVNQHLGG